MRNRGKLGALKTLTQQAQTTSRFHTLVFIRCFCSLIKIPTLLMSAITHTSLPLSPRHAKQAKAPSKRLKLRLRDSTRPQKRLQLSPRGFHSNLGMATTHSCSVVAWHCRERGAGDMTDRFVSVLSRRSVTDGSCEVRKALECCLVFCS